MKLRVGGALLALALGASLAVPASAQRKPTIAIMPCQWFSADADSADRITQGLVETYEGQGYTVIPMDKSRSTWSSMGLSPNQHYADSTAVKFGRAIGADLVAYPRLLALGIPAANPTPTDTTTSTTGKSSDMFAPEAVVHLRVLNVHSKAPIYFRQIGHEFSAESPADVAEFRLPQPVATAAVGQVTSVYFQRVAGSRQEFRGSR